MAKEKENGVAVAAPPARRLLAHGDRPSLAAVTKSSRQLPNRCLLYAREGWGKTSFAAQAKGVIFLCTAGEDGLDKLIETGQVPETDHFRDQAKTWGDVVAAVDELIVMDHDYRVLAIDTINGAQQLLFRHVVGESYGGSEKSFSQFGGVEGAKVAAVKFKELLARLDRLREAKNMSVLLLSHAQIAKSPNPEGVDFDKFTPALEQRSIYAELARWVDLILFGHVEVYAEKETKVARGKATGGSRRMLLTEARAWFDAKNRHGLQSEIECGESPESAWAAFIQAMQEGRRNG
jgi:hypothetical protein